MKLKNYQVNSRKKSVKFNDFKGVERKRSSKESLERSGNNMSGVPSEFK